MAEPPFGKQPLIGIIGGTGRMGLWFKRFFESQGLKPEAASRRTALTPAELAQRADVLILSVPISVVEPLAAELGPLVREEGLLMDLTSLKAAPVSAMLRSSRCEVIGAHPLFGPDAPSLAGHTVVLCPARGERWLPWLRGLLEGAGGRVVISEPRRHDQAMAAVQGLTHFDTLAFAHGLARLKLPLADLLELATPNFRLKVAQAARMLRQDPTLYAEIESRNPDVPSVLYSLARTSAELREAILSGNPDAFAAVFAEAADYFAQISDADFDILNRRYFDTQEKKES